MGLNDFYGLQQLALKSWLMSGDVFAVVKIRDPDKLAPLRAAAASGGG